MTNDQICTKWGLDGVALEALRKAMGGHFRTEHRRAESRMRFDYHELVERAKRGALDLIRPGETFLRVGDLSFDNNIVTNEGLDHLLDATLSGATQITAWKVAISKSNTTPLSTHTYASPGFTEITGSDVDESVRQAWTDAGVSSQSVTNAASQAVYTAAGTFTAYGAAMVGGGSGAATLDDSAGGGKLYSSALFGSSKSLVDDDALSTTYQLGMADDGA